MLTPTALRFVATFRGTGDSYSDAGLLAARLRAFGVQAYPRARGVVSIFEPNGKTYVDRSGDVRDSTSEKMFSIEELVSKASRAVQAIEVAHAAALLEDAARVAPPAKAKRSRKTKASK